MYGQRIRELREERNLTQAQLADRIGTTASTVGKYEREGLQPSVETIISLCKFFGVSADYLLGLEE